MKRRLVYIIVAVMSLAFFSGLFWFYETQYLVGRASVSQYSFSPDTSYVFVSPLRAKANGQEKQRLTVFVLNNQGLGVLGKKVVLENTKNLNVEVIQGLTDNFGKAVFDISTTQAGDYYLDVKVEETSLAQKARLSFY